MDGSENQITYVIIRNSLNEVDGFEFRSKRDKWVTYSPLNVSDIISLMQMFQTRFEGWEYIGYCRDIEMEDHMLVRIDHIYEKWPMVLINHLMSS